MKQIAKTLPLIVFVVACSSPVEKEPAPEKVAATKYYAELTPSETGDSRAVSNVLLDSGSDGSKLTLSVANMKAGTYGMHLHETGKCEAPDFKSAGGHWNPASKEHGLENPNGAHAGDIPNLVVAEDGKVDQQIHLPNMKIDDSLFMDADGAAFVIHAEPDDNITDPSGNSGARIFCGVFRKTE